MSAVLEAAHADVYPEQHAQAMEADGWTYAELDSLARQQTSNADDFADWLGGKCWQRTDVSSDRVCRMPVLIPTRLAEADVAELWHVWFNDADPLLVVAARDEMRRRYLADNGPALLRVAADRLLA